MMKLALLLISFAAVSACDRLSPTERKLVGSWNFQTIDSTTSLTYEADHTFSVSVWFGEER